MPGKGLPVFLDYDQGALDAAYDQAAYAPNREQLIKRRVRDSELARHRVGEPERVAYGSAEIERLDIYRARRKLAPVFIFIHGGAWRSGRSDEFAGPAEMFLAAGAHYVVPDFAWVQDVGGNLMVLTDQICRAVAWVYKNAARFDGDPNRLYIGGQSSGGHLAAVALTTDWQRQFNLPADIREPRADRQCGEPIDCIAAGAPVRKLLFIEALGHTRVPFGGSGRITAPASS